MLEGSIACSVPEREGANCACQRGPGGRLRPLNLRLLSQLWRVAQAQGDTASMAAIEDLAAQLGVSVSGDGQR